MSEEAGQLGSARSFETTEGTLTYTEVSERLAVALARILTELLQTPPHEIIITPDWLCQRHRELAGHLFPEWAGRFRTIDVEVGTLEPPAYYKVPLLVRSFCDDLAGRLRHVDDDNLPEIAAFLALVDWRFQWVHPFKDFNGRIGRVVLAVLLYKLALCPLSKPHQRTLRGVVNISKPCEPVTREISTRFKEYGSGDLEKRSSQSRPQVSLFCRLAHDHPFIHLGSRSDEQDPAPLDLQYLSSYAALMISEGDRFLGATSKTGYPSRLVRLRLLLRKFAYHSPTTLITGGHVDVSPPTAHPSR